jgi:hypothetical protein
MQVRIARSAETDLLEGYAFYEMQQSGIGEYFLDSLFADIDALALLQASTPSRMAGCTARWPGVSRSPSITRSRTTSPPWLPCSTAAGIRHRSRSG